MDRWKGKLEIITQLERQGVLASNSFINCSLIGGGKEYFIEKLVYALLCSGGGRSWHSQMQSCLYIRVVVCYIILLLNEI